MLVASAVAFVVALVSSLVATPLVRDAAERRDLLDEPGGRKIHARAVPRLGGAAMLLAFLLAVAVGVAADPATGGGHLRGDARRHRHRQRGRARRRPP